ncbi:hypothetical protein U9M48_034598 [Paspalum notatum var. saurae]|uniref:tRNA-uridine aminocarboxypropyltransferase n=1 Tax=Paspalum notatum var. saurae TaxID=547442 RepID=A0AAQ3X758_PASNO
MRPPDPRLPLPPPPPSPLPTSTTVVVLHHPHALRRNPLSTLPLLVRCLSNLHLVPGRRLLPSSTPALLPPPPSHSGPVLFLYPSPAASDLAAWCRATPPAARASPTLLLLDGTWRQAKEMRAASAPFLASLGAVPVALPVDGGLDGDSMFESELVVKKEPRKGCLSTMEAVARALRMLEPDASKCAKCAKFELVISERLKLATLGLGISECLLQPELLEQVLLVQSFQNASLKRGDLPDLELVRHSNHYAYDLCPLSGILTFCGSWYSISDK